MKHILFALLCSLIIGCNADPLIGRRVRVIGTDVVGVVEGHPYAFAEEYTVTYGDKDGGLRYAYLRSSALEIIEGDQP